MNVIYYLHSRILRHDERNSVQLQSLPPTSCTGAYYQIQTWLGCTLVTENGWRRTPDGLVPVATSKGPASQELLVSSFCVNAQKVALLRAHAAKVG